MIRPFHEWVSAQENSIEDASHIGPKEQPVEVNDDIDPYDGTASEYAPWKFPASCQSVARDSVITTTTSGAVGEPLPIRPDGTIAPWKIREANKKLEEAAEHQRNYYYQEDDYFE